MALLALRPRESVRTFARLDLSRLRHGAQVDDGNRVLGVHRRVDVRTVGRRKNAFEVAAQCDALDDGTRLDVDDEEVATAQVGDEGILAIGRDVHPFRAASHHDVGDVPIALRTARRSSVR